MDRCWSWPGRQRQDAGDRVPDRLAAGQRELSPRNLLAVTFTNKAAGEMARRVDELLLPVGLRSPLIATFHSACVRILRSTARTSACRRTSRSTTRTTAWRSSRSA
jgi:superfamily I DNA/RNA helicase